MIFLLPEFLEDRASIAWGEKHFHPQGLCCPGGGAKREEARECRKPERGGVDYRGRHCHQPYTLYTGPRFAGSKLTPRRVVV